MIYSVIIPCFVLALVAQATVVPVLEPRAKTLKPGSPCSFDAGSPQCSSTVCGYNENLNLVCSILTPELVTNPSCKKDSDCLTSHCITLGSGRKVCAPARNGKKCYLQSDCQSNHCPYASATATSGVCTEAGGQGDTCDLADGSKACPKQTISTGGPVYKLKCVSQDGNEGVCRALPASGSFKNYGDSCNNQAQPSECAYGCGNKFENNPGVNVCTLPTGSSCSCNSQCATNFCLKDPGFAARCFSVRAGDKCYASADCISGNCTFAKTTDRAGKCAKSATGATCVVDKKKNECATGKCVAVQGNGSIGSCQ